MGARGTKTISAAKCTRPPPVLLLSSLQPLLSLPSLTTDTLTFDVSLNQHRYGCPNITDRLDCVQGYHRCVWDAANTKCHDPPGPKPVCNHTLVGHLNLSQQDWGTHSHHGHKMSAIDFWHGNTLIKTGGFWFSTWAEGQCTDDPSQTFCSWRVAEEVKKVGKLCSDAAINAVIVKGDKSASWGANCFDKCSPADQKNTTSECWIECFYNNVLGPDGTSSLLNHSSPNFGIPMPDLRAAWDKPFLPVEHGGCPPEK